MHEFRAVVLRDFRSLKSFKFRRKSPTDQKQREGGAGTGGVQGERELPFKTKKVHTLMDRKFLSTCRVAEQKKTLVYKRLSVNIKSVRVLSFVSIFRGNMFFFPENTPCF